MGEITEIVIVEWCKKKLSSVHVRCLYACLYSIGHLCCSCISMPSVKAHHETRMESNSNFYLLLLAGLRQEHRVNVRHHATLRDCDTSQKLLQFLILTHGAKENRANDFNISIK